MAEAVSVSTFVALWMVGATLLASGDVWPRVPDEQWSDWVGLVLVLVGSFLNTASEVQRKWWKTHEENRGHCCTVGLWRLAMHINYFGDVVLFSGWVVVTAAWWMAWLPVLMAYNFAFHQGPELDEYLAKRYGDEFDKWQRSTKKLIPFVW